MTSFNTATATAAKQVSMKGNRNEGFAVARAAGVVGGVIAGVSNLGRGGSISGSAAGALVGGAVGYAIGDVLSFTDDLGVSAKILAGTFAGLNAASVGLITANLVDGMFGVDAGTLGE